MSECCVILRNMLIKMNDEDIFESADSAGAPVDVLQEFHTQVDPVHGIVEDEGDSERGAIGEDTDSVEDIFSRLELNQDRIKSKISDFELRDELVIHMPNAAYEEWDGGVILQCYNFGREETLA